METAQDVGTVSIDAIAFRPGNVSAIPDCAIPACIARGLHDMALHLTLVVKYTYKVHVKQMMSKTVMHTENLG